jgi:hypothetical protein
MVVSKMANKYRVGDLEHYISALTPNAEREFKEEIVNKKGDYYVRTKDNYDGYVALMCPECFHVVYKKVSSSSVTQIKTKELLSCPDDYDYGMYSHTSFYTCECEFCKESQSLIQLDPNIAKAISILNLKGYKTKFCCEGHPAQENVPDVAYIYFSDWILMSKFIDDLPFGWYLDMETYRNEHEFIIRAEYQPYMDYIYELEMWAKSIPYATEEEATRDLRAEFFASFFNSVSDVYGEINDETTDAVIDFLQKYSILRRIRIPYTWDLILMNTPS